MESYHNYQGKVGLEVEPEVGVEAARRTGEIHFVTCIVLRCHFDMNGS